MVRIGIEASERIGVAREAEAVAGVSPLRIGLTPADQRLAGAIRPELNVPHLEAAIRPSKWEIGSHGLVRSPPRVVIVSGTCATLRTRWCRIRQQQKECV